MTFLDKLRSLESSDRAGELVSGKQIEGIRVFKIHNDVIQTAKNLADEDDKSGKLERAAPQIFFPFDNTWIEWQDEVGHLGFHFKGYDGSHTEGKGFLAMMGHRYTLLGPMCQELRFDTRNYELEAILPPDTDFKARVDAGVLAARVKPLLFAILALINSPKVVKQTPIDVSRINKQRQARGRYTFHPHHEVRLNIDKQTVTTTAGHGNGASKALHPVKAHLRLIPHLGKYVMVKSHWRGDAALGIRNTSYVVDRQNSRWPD